MSALAAGYRKIQAHLSGRLTEAWRQPGRPSEPPLRAELFSADQMARHGKVLAETHVLATSRLAPARLLARLDDNERVLVDVCRQLSGAVADNRRIAPAGEWLLDNLYLIEEQIRVARQLLPKGYSRQLPLLGGDAATAIARRLLAKYDAVDVSPDLTGYGEEGSSESRQLCLADENEVSVECP